jgi:hypothetical protein
MVESIAHGERARYLAAIAVRDLQHGLEGSARNAMDMVAMERHLQYEKWDTAQIASAALKECWERYSWFPVRYRKQCEV